MYDEPNDEVDYPPTSDALDAIQYVYTAKAIQHSNPSTGLKHLIGADFGKFDKELANFYLSNNGLVYIRQDNKLIEELQGHHWSLTGRMSTLRPPFQNITPEGNESDMSLASKKASLQQQLDMIMERLAKLSQFPEEDPGSDTDVIRFDKKFPGNDQAWSYVAIRVEGKWYLSGGERGRTGGMTWAELTNWMGEGVEWIFLMYLGRQVMPVVKEPKWSEPTALPTDAQVNEAAERDWMKKEVRPEKSGVDYPSMEKEATPENLQTKTGDYFSRPIKDNPQA